MYNLLLNIMVYISVMYYLLNKLNYIKKLLGNIIHKVYTNYPAQWLNSYIIKAVKLHLYVECMANTPDLSHTKPKIILIMAAIKPIICSAQWIRTTNIMDMISEYIQKMASLSRLWPDINMICQCLVLKLVSILYIINLINLKNLKVINIYMHKYYNTKC